ncbi:unnamed protein product [Effrenium voratum]|uniref:Ion transport domain-containing protein n=1 Tax=Effrenium voratum TaxID=2562239 RepID=A0AA36NFA6_9DINO|nr:unnamed protein product [Effrenium voratum]
MWAFRRTLLHVLKTYHPDYELEDLQSLVYVVVKGYVPESPQTTMTQLTNTSLRTNNSSTSSLQKKVPAGRRTSTMVDCPSLDLSAFQRLRRQELDGGAANATFPRDLLKLRTALRSEELQVLFSDAVKTKDPEEFYVPSGRVAKWLEFVPAIVITLNSLSFAFQEAVPGDAAWEIVESCFMAFYFLEASVKLYLMGCRGYFRGPEGAWNSFDFFCLLTSLFDFGVTQAVFLMGASSSVDLSVLMLLKMLRLARLFRLIRALRYSIFRELNMMVMGVVSGIRVLIWAIILLFVFIYIVGVALNKLIGEDEEEFGSLVAAMFTLFRCFTDGCAAYDGTPLQERLRKKYGMVFFMGYILVFMLVTVGIFNLIMAIFIDNVMTSQLERKQRDLSETASTTELALKEVLCRLLVKTDSLVPAETEESMRTLDSARLSRQARVRAKFDCLLEADVARSSDLRSHFWLTTARAMTHTLKEKALSPGSQNTKRERAAQIRKSFQRPKFWVMGFGWCLAACAGAANVIALKSWNLYASHVTGSTSAMAFRLEGYHQGEFGSETFREAFFLVFSFLVGAYTCGLLIDKNQVHFGGKSFYGLALLMNSCLLVEAAFIPGRLLPACLVAGACGLQNAMCTSHFGAIVRTTHVTGTVTDIGSTLGRISMIYLRKGCRRSRLDDIERAEVGVDARKLAVLFGLWSFYFVGGLVGIYMENLIPGPPTRALLVPAFFTGSLGLFYVAFRQLLKEALMDYIKRLEEARLQSHLQEAQEAIAHMGTHLQSLENGDLMELDKEMGQMMEALHEVSQDFDQIRSQSRVLDRKGTSCSRLSQPSHLSADVTENASQSRSQHDGFCASRALRPFFGGC